MCTHLKQFKLSSVRQPQQPFITIFKWPWNNKNHTWLISGLHTNFFHWLHRGSRNDRLYAEEEDQLNDHGFCFLSCVYLYIFGNYGKKIIIFASRTNSKNGRKMHYCGRSLEPWVCKSHNQMLQMSLSPWLLLYLNMKATDCWEEVFSTLSIRVFFSPPWHVFLCVSVSRQTRFWATTAE